MPKKKYAKSERASIDDLSESIALKPFQWNKLRSDVATYLAQGYTWKETATQYEISEPTIANWKRHPDFSAEVDRLSIMVDVAGRAYRLRTAMRVIRAKGFTSERDLLDWLKFAQSETDGVKLDLARLASALGEDASSLADSRPSGVGAEQNGTPAAGAGRDGGTA